MEAVKAEPNGNHNNDENTENTNEGYKQESSVEFGQGVGDAAAAAAMEAAAAAARAAAVAASLTANGTTSSTDSSTSSSKLVSSKAYKTMLCQYYLQGTCKNGDGCSYAHGTSELRTPMQNVNNNSNVENNAPNATVLKSKSRLCENFLSYGECRYGNTCNFAHGIKDIQKSLNDQHSSINPAFKTALCKNYTATGSCSFGPACQYAHGVQELRVKQAVTADSSSAFPASSTQATSPTTSAGARPEVKTRLCKNWTTSGSCQYGAKCNFAHGQEELRPTLGPFGSALKTVMCRNLPDCTYGPRCRFAHSEEELRQRSPLTTVNSAPPRAINSKYKTVICNDVMSKGYCARGDQCTFAHSAMELAHYTQNTPRASTYKTSMCQTIVKGETCEKGESCRFAHTMAERKLARQMDPRYKTIMCNKYVSGSCEDADNCTFAHGPEELRTAQTPNMIPGAIPGVRQAGVPPPPGTVASAYPGAAGPAAPPPPGTAMFYGDGGGYGAPASGWERPNRPLPPPPPPGLEPGGAAVNPMGGVLPVVVGGSNYKTVMCRNITSGLPCPHGVTCKFAHSTSELRQTENGVGGPLKRKTSQPALAKTVLCKNYAVDGNCSYGEKCNFAHGNDELVTSKRQRL